MGQVSQYLQDMKGTMASDGLKVLYGPTEEDLKNCAALGQQIGQMVKGK